VPYILPAVPPLAVLIALALEGAEADRQARAWVRAGGAVGALLLAALAAGLVAVALGWVKAAGAVLLPGVLTLAFPTLIACLLSAGLWWRGRLRSLAALALAPALLVICLVALSPAAVARISAEPIAGFLAPRLQVADEVYAYHCYPQTLPVYLRRQIGVVDYQGELAFGIGHLPAQERARRFPTAGEFLPTWRSAKTVYLVLERENLARMTRDGLAPGPILMRQEKYLLMTNRPASPAAAPGRSPG
jgi:hypothetical protein